jgi:hypothetical protein
MASFSAELRVAGHAFPVLQCRYGMSQGTHQRGRVSTKVRHELVYLTLNVPEGDVLLAWAADAHRRQAAAVVFTNAAGGGALETLLLPAAYCVSYAEAFVAGDAQNGAYVCHLVLSEPDGFTMQAGGPAGAFVAPAPREHGLPQAVAMSRVAELPQREHEEPTNPVDPGRMALWVGYLERRGVTFEIGTPVAQLKLYDTNSVGLYALHTRTIYLSHPPNAAAFFEEVFHALQHLRNQPRRKTLAMGQDVDAWEYDAKQALLSYAEKLGLSYEEYIETEKQLHDVINNDYDNDDY